MATHVYVLEDDNGWVNAIFASEEAAESHILDIARNELPREIANWEEEWKKELTKKRKRSSLSATQKQVSKARALLTIAHESEAVKDWMTLYDYFRSHDFDYDLPHRKHFEKHKVIG